MGPHGQCNIVNIHLRNASNNMGLYRYVLRVIRREVPMSAEHAAVLLGLEFHSGGRGAPTSARRALGPRGSQTCASVQQPPARSDRVPPRYGHA
eukprot:6021732-Pyramimonas_sp.AAC.2